jgi:hypothetical protein
VLFLVGGTVGTEALPAVFGSGFAATWDWGLPYVTMRFILLPATALVVLGGTIVQVVRHGSLPVEAWLAGAAASLYFASLWYWPVMWFA